MKRLLGFYLFVLYHVLSINKIQIKKRKKEKYFDRVLHIIYVNIYMNINDDRITEVYPYFQFDSLVQMIIFVFLDCI